MIRTLDRVTTRKQLAPKRSAKAFNPLARDEAQLFRALLDGQHMIRGFYNPDIRNKLKDSPHLKEILDPRRQSAKVTRIFNRFHAHGLIAKISHSRRWRLTGSSSRWRNGDDGRGARGGPLPVRGLVHALGAT